MSDEPLVYSEGQYQAALRFQVDYKARVYFADGVDAGAIVALSHPNWSPALIEEQARLLILKRHGGNDEILETPIQ